ncbi:MAG: hypothetical protein ACXADA_22485 [Candidatus Hodarchaeales archaeon]|jgi:hypothetical protein
MASLKKNHTLLMIIFFSRKRLDNTKKKQVIKLKQIKVLLLILFIMSCLPVESIFQATSNDNPIDNTTDNTIDNHVDQSKSSITDIIDPTDIFDNDSWIDYPVDDDDNGLYDRLVIDGIQINSSQEIYMYAILKDSSGQWLGYSVNNSYYGSSSSTNISFSFNGESIHSSGIDGQYEVWISAMTEIPYPTEITSYKMYTTTTSYNHSDFEVACAIMTGFSDNIRDTDSDGKYNEIVIEVTIDTSKAGDYTAGILLNVEDPFDPEAQEFAGSWWGSLDVGTDVIELIIPTTGLYSAKMNGPYSVGFAFLAYSGIEMIMPFQHFLINAHNTSAYNYTDFDVPPVLLTGNYWDHGEDTNFDEKIDQITIDIEVNVTEAGSYSLDLSLASTEGNYNLYGHVYDDWQTGLQNISVSMDVPSLYPRRVNTSFVIQHVGIYNYDYGSVVSAYSCYTTRIYNYYEFEIPDAYLTGNYYDYGEDTDDDGKFNDIIIDVEVNVTRTGQYKLDMDLRTSKGDYFWKENEGYWVKGLQNISIKIDGNMFYYKKLNTSFEVQHVSLHDDYNNNLDSVYEPYTTKKYYYYEFDLPGIILTGNYNDHGVDTDEDGKFNQLIIDVEVNVTEPGNYNIELALIANASNYFDHLWGHTSGYYDVGVQNIPVVVESFSLFTQQINTTFLVEFVNVLDSNYYMLDQAYEPYETRTYFYYEFDSPRAYLTGEFDDNGKDTDNNGYFDQIIINIGFNVTENGEYSVFIGLHSTTSGYGLWGETIETLTEGIHMVSVAVDATGIWPQRLNSSYIVDYIGISEINSNYSIIEYYQPYETNYYYYYEFDPPGVFLTGNYYDHGDDVDNDGDYDQLIIDVEVDVTEAGYYYLELSLMETTHGYYLMGSTSSYWIAGIQNISVSIDVKWLFDKLELEYSSFTISQVYIRNSNHDMVDRDYTYSHETSVYSYEDFHYTDSETTSVPSSTTGTNTSTTDQETTTTNFAPGWTIQILFLAIVLIPLTRKIRTKKQS